MFCFFAVASCVVLLLSGSSQLHGASGQSLPSGDLSGHCSTLLCDTMKVVTTCPLFGISWTPICAEYLMGFLFQCPGYPAKEDIYDAPSICLPEYLTVAAKLNNGSKPIDVAGIMSGNYSEHCYEGCFQDYIDATYAYNAYGCPLGNFSLLSIPLNAFRGIACGSTNGTRETERNCYDILTSLIPTPSPTPSPTPAPTTPNPLTDYTCSALAIPMQGPIIYNTVCGKFTTNECCLGNHATMLSQSFQMPFPPCLMKHCYMTSKAINDFCGSHINFATGTIQAWVDMATLPPYLPNMYDKNVTGAFQFNLVIPFRGAIMPQEVTFYDFTYYDNNGAVLTQNNVNAYKSAARGNFSFTVTLVNVTQAALLQYSAIINNATYAISLVKTYNTTKISSATKKTTFYAADPIDVSASSAPSFFATAWILSVIVMFTTMYFNNV